MMNRAQISSLLKRGKTIGLLAALTLLSPCLGADAVRRVTLSDAFEQALAHDAEFQAARQLRSSRYEQEPQNLARLLPSIDISANYTQHEFGRPLTGQAQEFRQSERIGLNLSQPLYNRADWYRYRQTGDQLSIADLDLQRAEQALALDVSEAYFGILLAQRTLDLAGAESEAYAQQWEKARASLQRGFSTRTDLLDTKARYDEAQSRVLAAENAVRIARLRLRRRIGEDAALVSLDQVALDAYQPAPLDAADWQVKVSEGNRDILKARAERDLAIKEVAVQQSGHYPRLSLQAGISSAYNEDQTAVQGDEKRVMLQLQLPLYEGGAIDSRVRDSAYRKAQAEAQLRATRELAEQEMKSLLATLETNAANIEAFRATVESWDLFVESAEKSHRFGLKDLFTVLDARARRFAAQRDLAATVHDELLNRLRLVALAGLLGRPWFEQMDQILFASR